MSKLPEIFAKAAKLALATGTENLAPGEPWRWDIGGYWITINRSGAPCRDCGNEIPPYTLLVMWPGGAPIGLVDFKGGCLLGANEEDIVACLDRAIYMRTKGGTSTE